MSIKIPAIKDTSGWSIKVFMGKSYVISWPGAAGTKMSPFILAKSSAVNFVAKVVAILPDHFRYTIPPFASNRLTLAKYDRLLGDKRVMKSIFSTFFPESLHYFFRAGQRFMGPGNVVRFTMIAINKAYGTA